MQRRHLFAVPSLMAASALGSGPAQAQTAPLPITRPGDVGLNAERLARIGEAFEGEIAAGRLPGAVIMVARRGKLAYAQTLGFRDRQANARMSADDIFRIYSMTKPWSRWRR